MHAWNDWQCIIIIYWLCRLTIVSIHAAKVQIRKTFRLRRSSSVTKLSLSSIWISYRSHEPLSHYWLCTIWSLIKPHSHSLTFLSCTLVHAMSLSSTASTNIYRTGLVYMTYWYIHGIHGMYMWGEDIMHRLCYVCLSSSLVSLLWYVTKQVCIHVH